MSTQEPRVAKASLKFPRGARITRGAELQRIVREGKRIRTHELEIRVVASPRAHSMEPRPSLRVGLVVPLYKHSAVLRNQLKRRLRELVRIEILPIQKPLDVVVKIYPTAYRASFANLAHDIARIAKELHGLSLESSREERPS